MQFCNEQSIIAEMHYRKIYTESKVVTNATLSP